ncbi:divergent polysaccharide deacetylase family protein [Rhodanobacter aciditrophus]|uniref:Divergent polysaccharide deacetylase family protein n=1 Tax=Rhodanobacter aciditrophus TaxID=1623218 RepID=A0ABW4B0J1_9GAMM
MKLSETLGVVKKTLLVFALLWGSFGWALVGDSDVVKGQEASVLFPVLDRSKPAHDHLFPILMPVEKSKPEWPPLFKQPDSPMLDDSKSDMALGNISAMDFLPAPPKISVIIDDVGYNRRGMEESLALPLPVVLAILPMTPYANQAAEAAKKQQRVTILHAPMENQRELKLGPGGLYVNMDEAAFKKVLNEDLDSVPWVQGVNNHMGSLLTTHRASMEWVMDVMAKRSLFFVDSLTDAKSVAHVVASERQIRTVTRDVFLDNVKTQSAINKQFEILIKKAHKYGAAVAIGHPYPETMHYLHERLAQPLSVQLVSIKEQLH